MDNCVGQNKSQLRVKMNMLMTIVFDVDIDDLFPKPGHSHNTADAVVAWLNNALRGQDWFHPADQVERYNMVKGRSSTLLTNADFFIFGDLLNKFFPFKLPNKYTNNFYRPFGITPPYGGAAGLFFN